MNKDNKSWLGRHKVLTVIGVIILLAIIGGAAGGNKSSNNTTNSSSTASKTEPTATAEPKQPAVPADYKSALNQAGSYANNLHMSKQGVLLRKNTYNSRKNGKLILPSTNVSYKP